MVEISSERVTRYDVIKHSLCIILLMKRIESFVRYWRAVNSEKENFGNYTSIHSTSYINVYAKSFFVDKMKERFCLIIIQNSSLTMFRDDDKFASEFSRRNPDPDPWLFRFWIRPSSIFAILDPNCHFLVYSVCLI